MNTQTLEDCQTELDRVKKESADRIAGLKSHLLDRLDELEAAEKQAAEMREALLEAKVTCESGDHDQNNYALAKIVSALSCAAGHDHFHRDQLKPLVEALTRINEISVVDEDMGCAVNWAGDALNHARKLGLLTGQNIT